MDVMVTAGGIPKPDDPLYVYTQGKSKALADVAGKPMVQWILDALGKAKSVDNIVIVGLSESDGVSCEKPLYYVPNQGSMINNIKAGAAKITEINPQSDYCMIASSDVPTITPDMVDWVASSALETDHDVYFNVIERSVMEKRFPGSKRTYTKLKGIQLCGGDINVIRTFAITAQEELWNKMEANRKNPLKQAMTVGLDTLFLILFRLVDHEGAARYATKSLGLKCRAILCPHAEIGMDVDKPHQLELLAADLSK